MLSWSNALLLLRWEIMWASCATSTLTWLDSERWRISGAHFCLNRLFLNSAMSWRYLIRVIRRWLTCKWLFIDLRRLLERGGRFSWWLRRRWLRQLALRVWNLHLISLRFRRAGNASLALCSSWWWRSLLFAHQHSYFAEVWRVIPVYEFFLTDTPIAVSVSHSERLKRHWNRFSLFRRR